MEPGARLHSDGNEAAASAYYTSAEPAQPLRKESSAKLLSLSDHHALHKAKSSTLKLPAGGTASGCSLDLSTDFDLPAAMECTTPTSDKDPEKPAGRACDREHGSDVGSERDGAQPKSFYRQPDAHGKAHGKPARQSRASPVLMDSLYVVTNPRTVPWDEGRYRHSTVLYKDALFVFGGSKDLNLYTNAISYYDISMSFLSPFFSFFSFFSSSSSFFFIHSSFFLLFFIC